MRVARAKLERLIEAFGEPINGCWDIAHEGNWIEVKPHKKPGLFQVNCLLSEFTRTISNEVAFKEAYVNYFEEI